MKLGAYLKSLSAEEKKSFADKVGTSLATLYQYVGGHVDPSPKRAKEIHDVSHKKIDLWELRPDVWDPPANVALLAEKPANYSADKASKSKHKRPRK